VNDVDDFSDTLSALKTAGGFLYKKSLEIAHVSEDELGSADRTFMDNFFYGIRCAVILEKFFKMENVLGLNHSFSVDRLIGQLFQFFMKFFTGTIEFSRVSAGIQDL
jgi:hypothetical protein